MNMDFNEFTVVINTVLLIIIFFYQRNRNKVLIDRIEEQEKVIVETKGIIMQQSTAIDSQSKVVDTAIKYSEAFSPEKLEAMIRREIEIEQKEKQNDINIKANSSLTQLADIFGEQLSNHLTPFVEVIVKLLISLPKDERDQFVDEMEDGDAKEMLIKVLEKVDIEMNKIISNKKKALGKI